MKGLVFGRALKQTSDRDAKINASSECLENVINQVGEEVNSQKDALSLQRKVREIIGKICYQYHENLRFKDVGYDPCVRSLLKSPKKQNSRNLNLNRLIYGKVQSGKTYAAIGTTALAKDNNFKCIIVLTSDNVWLASQTLKRFKTSLNVEAPKIYGTSKRGKEPKIFALKIINEIIAAHHFENEGVVFVFPKNTNHLENLCEILKQTKAFKYPSLIIDDEADQASLDRNRKKRSQGQVIDSTTIYKKISRVKDLLPHHIFLQLTATPQALLLQTQRDSKPARTILLEPGESYIGGETFFSGPNKYVKTHPTLAEIDELKVGIKKIPISLQQAIVTFLVGAAFKIEKKYSERIFSFLVHVCHQIVSHEVIEKGISDFLNTCKKELRQKKSPKIDNLVISSFAELKIKKTPILFQKIKKIIGQRLNSVNLYSINKNWQCPEPEYNEINILVGGNRLSRGVTIQGLMGMYYGRDARSKKMDTVHQHARIFGYRKDLLEVTRIYMPKEIFENYCNIFCADEATRQAILNDSENPPVFVGRGMVPTRSDVLDTSNIEVFRPGHQSYPFKPKYEGYKIRKNTRILDNMLSKYFSDKGEKYHDVDIRFIKKLVELMPTYSSAGSYDVDRVLRYLEAVEKTKGPPIICTLLAKRNLNRERGPNGVASGFASGEWFENEKRENCLLFIAMRQNGLKKQNWGGMPFYVPTIRFPKKGLLAWYAKKK